jgi:hypothetical protein
MSKGEAWTSYDGMLRRSLYIGVTLQGPIRQIQPSGMKDPKCLVSTLISSY